jgi:hypothetical protein
VKTGYLIGAIMLFVILAVVFGLAENSYMGANETSTLDTLMAPFMQSGLFSGVKVMVGSLFSGEYLDALWRVFWWEYPSVFHGDWIIARYAFFMPLSIGILIALALAFFRGTSSS